MYKLELKLSEEAGISVDGMPKEVTTYIILPEVDLDLTRYWSNISAMFESVGTDKDIYMLKLAIIDCVTNKSVYSFGTMISNAKQLQQYIINALENLKEIDSKN